MFKAQTLITKRTVLQAVYSSGKLTTPSSIGWRNASTNIRAHSKRRSGLIVASGGALLALGLSPFYISSLHGDAAQTAISSRADESHELSLKDLLRSYMVYTMCSIPSLVDHAPQILQLGNIPGLKRFTEAFVRATFFDQFVGGDTAQATLPLLRNLRSANKGALFAYSVEVDESEATSSLSNTRKKESPPHKRIVDEMIRCIDVAAEFEDGVASKSNGGRRTWVAVKITALLPDAQALINLSSHILATRPTSSQPIAFPGSPRSTDLDILYKPPASLEQASSTLSVKDTASLRELHKDLIRICTRAQEKGVKIIVDAEYSWYQPALDALTLSLMRRFNKLPSRGDSETSKVQPLVYGTYQAYLRRTPAHLAQSLADAKADHYALGVKLVRGAYHPHELAAYEARSVHGKSLSISQDPHPPVWTTKPETDACYNACAKVLLGTIKDDMSLPLRKSTPSPPSVGVLFGTHNWDSCALILDELTRLGLARKKPEGDSIMLGDDVTERLTIGQLYGMCDGLTDYLVHKTSSNTPLIMKYIPYGALSEVMPYLSRRAIENKSVLGNGAAASERRRAGAEIRRRLFGFSFT